MLFKLDKEGRQVYGRLLKATREYWRAFLFGVIGTLVLSGVDAGFAWLIKPIINEGFINKNTHFITWLPLAIVIIFLLRGCAGFASSYYIVRVARCVVRDFRQKIFAHLLKLPSRFYDQHSSGHILSTIVYNVEQVAEASSNALLILLRELALAVGLMVVMFVISWKLTLLFVVLGPVLAWIIKVTSRRMRRLSGNVQQTVGDITHVAEESIEGYKVIRVYGGQNYESNKFNKTTDLGRQRELKVAVTNSIGTSIVQVIIAVPIALTLWFATSPTLGISAGAFAAMIAALLQLLRPVRRLTLVNNTVQSGLAAAESIFELLDKPAEKDSGDYRVDRSKGQISFKAVGFAYGDDDSKATLSDISFDVAPGQVVALVGRSGAGKTTLINLLPRFYELQSGEITIDGVPIQQYELANLRQQMSLVSQHATLFNDTIAHNIAYGAGSSEYTEQDIINAAEAAHAMEFINELPQGLNTMIGENGVLLSGGQRQRLAIARALLKDAPILILDEATSALDSHAERHIQQALSHLMQNRTTLVIAHRLSTIENADKIVVLEQGKLIEHGTHDELLQAEGNYASLHAVQFGATVST
ncbi:MAG: lipid A export permease/ATP-binding protein MsbA [Coxiellaceae bacterium]|nr:lipid A export permease/ATP-binding protein MsbA [Coxiellaceae bacterium]